MEPGDSEATLFREVVPLFNRWRETILNRRSVHIGEKTWAEKDRNNEFVINE
jgi:hypothetical protein